VIYDAQCAHPCQPFAFQHLPHSTAAGPTFIAIPLLLRRYTARRLRVGEDCRARVPRHLDLRDHGDATVGRVADHLADVVLRAPGRWLRERVPPYEKAWIPPAYQRQVVQYQQKEAPGSILVDTGARYVYFVLPEGKAIRYGAIVGEDSQAWAGVATVGRKEEWPG
jgi:hypothetical protein